jgi:hypothetical protein
VLQFLLRLYRTSFLGKQLQDRGQICRNFDEFASAVLSFARRKIDKQAIQLYLAPIEPFDLSTTQAGEIAKKGSQSRSRAAKNGFIASGVRISTLSFFFTRKPSSSSNGLLASTFHSFVAIVKALLK